jgi:PAS domain S-box-containing protein
VVALNSRLGVCFIVISSFILGTALMILSIFAVHGFYRLGDQTALYTKQFALSRAKEHLSRETHGWAALCGEMFRQAEDNVRNMARQAAFCLDNLDTFGKKEAPPRSEWERYAPNGVWTNGAASLASMVYWGAPEPAPKAVRMLNALSWTQQAAAFAHSSTPQAKAAWLIMKSGAALYYPNIHHVERMPAVEEFDFRDDICFTSAAPENNPEGRTLWTDVYQDSLGLGLMITVTAPCVSASGEFLGSAGVDIRVDDLVSDLLGVKAGKEKPFRFLMDSKGDVLAFPLELLPRFGISVKDYKSLAPGALLNYSMLDSTIPGVVEALKRALSGPASGLVRVRLDDGDVLIGYQRIASTGWLLGEVRDVSDILKAVTVTDKTRTEAINRFVATFFGLSIACLAISVGFVSFFFSHRVLKPVQSALDAVEAISKGESPRRLEESVHDEIGHLARGINDMVARLQSREASLREAEARYRSMVENAMEGIFRISSDGRFLRANPAMARMMGYASVEELKSSVNDVRLLLHMDNGGRSRFCRRLIGEGALEGEEVQGSRPDGELFWMEVSCRLAAEESDRRRSIDGFARDISERKARQGAERELKAAEAASLSKSLFLANMSHEIRTPMNIVLGATDMLQKSALTADQRGYVNLLRESGETLLALISDVLDLSKIEAGKIELQEEDFDLPGLIQQLMDIFSVQAGHKGLRLHSLVSPEVPAALHGDANRLRQVLSNLLGNSVKFTSQGEIFFEASLANPPSEADDVFEVLFLVRDTGPGVPSEKQAAIFEAFTQAEGVAFGEFGGAGLGLAITRSLVEIMGGGVWCESQAGRGSSFWVALPFKPAAKTPGSAEAVDFSASDLPPVSVLMVEDNDLNRMLFEYYLEDAACSLTLAENGQKGVEAFRNGNFDIVFMDVSMPVMDGLAATRAIREIERERGVAPAPIVALTAHAMAGDEQRCMEAGCTRYLVKPVRRRDVLRLIVENVGTAQGAPA